VVYGQLLSMPSKHPLPSTMAIFPQHNRPLGLAAEVLSHSNTDQELLAAIDVGANIGDTVALIEQHSPDAWTYLCIEPDPVNAEFCVANHAGNARVQIERVFIGEDEGANVWLQDDGRANPSTRRDALDEVSSESGTGKLVRLDTAAAPFALCHGIDLIKVDTEGYDFHVLRSGQTLLNKYKPVLFFELFPALLHEASDCVQSGFDYLAQLGYRHFIFFTNQGDLYCTANDPDPVFLKGMESITHRNPSLPYFDVFASTRKDLCDRLVEKNIELVQDTANSSRRVNIRAS
jgi:FkbM family methyltransferase